jgi:hypothetical protein
MLVAVRTLRAARPVDFEHRSESAVARASRTGTRRRPTGRNAPEPHERVALVWTTVNAKRAERRLLALAKTPMPIGSMTDDELDAFAIDLFERAATAFDAPPTQDFSNKVGCHDPKRTVRSQRVARDDAV